MAVDPTARGRLRTVFTPARDVQIQFQGGGAKAVHLCSTHPGQFAHAGSLSGF